jgi:hypothetical protein
MVHEEGDCCCAFVEAPRHKDAVCIFIQFEGYWLCPDRCETKENYARTIGVSELM